MNRFLIKVIMVIFLFLGSLATFVNGVPFQFNYVGTVVMPVAIFLLVDGYFYTSSKEKYVKRLIVGGEIMFIVNIILSFVFINNGDKNISFSGLPNKIYIEAVIFIIIAVVFLILNLRNKLLNDGGIIFIVFILSVIGTVFSVATKGHMYLLRNNMFIALAGIIVLLNALEGSKDKHDKRSVVKVLIAFAICLVTQPSIIGPGFAFIIYSFRQNKRMIATGLFVLSGLFIPAFNLKAMLEKPMWMMFFGIIFIILYNNKEGAKIKKPFYFVYPLCIWIPFIIGYLVR